jgi:hypothetical protein
MLSSKEVDEENACKVEEKIPNEYDEEKMSMLRDVLRKKRSHPGSGGVAS